MKGKKILSVLLVLAMMVTAMLQTPVNKQAKAAEIGNAVYYTLGTDRYGMITEDDREQYYQFILPTSGRIDITGFAYMEYITLRIYDSNAQEIFSSRPHWNSTSEVIPLDESAYLTSGVYYIEFERYYHDGNYNFNISFSSTDESFFETKGGSNNSLATANEIWTNGTQYTGQIALNDEKDFYKFNLNQSGKVDFNATFYKMKEINWKLYDVNGEQLVSSNPSWNSTTENIVVNETLHLTSGSYYLVFDLYYRSENYYGKYQYSLSFTSSNETYQEGNGGINNTTSSASALTLGTAYTGQIAINDEKDFYKFSLSSQKAVNYQVNADKVGYITIKLYDGFGNELWYTSPSWNSSSEKIVWSHNEILEAGTYYFAIERYYNDLKYNGNYTLKISNITPSTCDHDYETSWYDATYFSQGYRLHTCKWCGHSYKTDYESVKKLSQRYFYTYDSYAMKKKVYLKWSTDSDASGYQIRYSRNKSMQTGVKYKKAAGTYTNSKTISGLGKKKTWYFQIRSYKTSGGQTVYGKWSSKLKLKTKK